MSKQWSSLLLLLCLGFFVYACQASEQVGEEKQEEDAERAQQDEEHEQPELPVVSFDFKGHKVSVPVYEDVSGFTQVRLDFDKKTITEVMDITQELLTNLIVNKKNVLVASGPAIGNIIKVGIRQQRNYKKLPREDRMPFFKPEFNKEMSHLMLAVLGTKYQGERLTDDEIYARAMLLVDSIRQVTEHSPSGLYVNWAKLELDGERLDLYCAPIIEWFNRSSGRRFCLKGVKSIAAFVEKIK